MLLLVKKDVKLEVNVNNCLAANISVCLAAHMSVCLAASFVSFVFLNAVYREHLTLQLKEPAGHG